MKKAIIGLLVLGFVPGFLGTGFAANTATQTITLTVAAIDEISVSNNAVSLTINSAVAGSEPTSATDASTSYALTTNAASRKITGQITTGGDMPANTTLGISLVAPTGGTSSGSVLLTSGSPSDLVTGIIPIAQSARTITYTFSATVTAGVLPAFQRTVTLTLTP